MAGGVVPHGMVRVGPVMVRVGAAATGAAAGDTVVVWLSPSVTDTATVTELLLPSAAVGVYVRPVAPGIAVHEVPLIAHASHWYEYVSGAVPDQVPGLAVRGWPGTAYPYGSMPEIEGGTLLDGGAGSVQVMTTSPLPFRTPMFELQAMAQ